jgi:hypothetical protein
MYEIDHVLLLADDIPNFDVTEKTRSKSNANKSKAALAQGNVKKNSQPDSSKDVLSESAVIRSSKTIEPPKVQRKTNLTV